MGNAAIDLIIRIKNGYRARRQQVECSYSRFGEEVVKKLKSLGYIADYAIEGDVIKKIVITLAYEDGEPAVTDVKIFSTPGRRWYTQINNKEAKGVGLGQTLLTTSRGILTYQEAKKEKIGGELLFSIW